MCCVYAIAPHLWSFVAIKDKRWRRYYLNVWERVRLWFFQHIPALFSVIFFPLFYFSLLFVIHSEVRSSTAVHSELLSLCEWRCLKCWKISPSRSDSLQQSRRFQCSACLWWYTIAVLHSWESSVKGPLRETSLHCFPQSCCILVLNSRQMCLFCHPEGSCIVFSSGAYRKGLNRVTTHFYLLSIHQDCSSIGSLLLKMASAPIHCNQLQFKWLMKLNCYLMTKTKLNFFLRAFLRENMVCVCTFNRF